MLQKRQAFQLQLYPERLMAWVELGRKPEIMYWKFANAWPMYPVHSPADDASYKNAGDCGAGYYQSVSCTADGASYQRGTAVWLSGASLQ